MFKQSWEILLVVLEITLAQDFVTHHLGQQFIQPPAFNLATSFKDGTPNSPLIFVLSPGADPMADLLKLVEDDRFSQKFEKVGTYVRSCNYRLFWKFCILELKDWSTFNTFAGFFGTRTRSKSGEIISTRYGALYVSVSSKLSFVAVMDAGTGSYCG